MQILRDKDPGDMGITIERNFYEKKYVPKRFSEMDNRLPGRDQTSSAAPAETRPASHREGSQILPPGKSFSGLIPFFSPPGGVPPGGEKIL